MALIVGFWQSYGLGGPFTVYGLFASIGSIPIIVVYMAMCAASIVYFRRVERNFNPALHVLIPVIGFVIFALAVYASVWPVPSQPYNIVPYVGLVWLLLGIGVLLYLRSNHPQRVEQIGSILGEEGGEEAAVLDAHAAPVTGA
jgi:amino acid transporter